MKTLGKEKLEALMETMRWTNVTQKTVNGVVYVPFDEYKRDVGRLRKRVAELEAIHKQAEALFGKVEYRERERSWRD